MNELQLQDRQTADQDRAILKAREYLHEGRRAAVVDTETTGLDGEVFEFAAVDAQTAQPVLCWLANASSAEWSDRAAEMHDHRLEDIARAPNVSVFEAATLASLKGRLCLAYNANFDRAALERTLGGVDLLPDWADIAELYAPFVGRWSESRQTWKFASLAEACQFEDIDLTSHHTAYADARAAANLLLVIAQKLTSAEQEARDEEAAAQVYADDLDTETAEF